MYDPERMPEPARKKQAAEFARNNPYAPANEEMHDFRHGDPKFVTPSPDLSTSGFHASQDGILQTFDVKKVQHTTPAVSRQVKLQADFDDIKLKNSKKEGKTTQADKEAKETARAKLAAYEETMGLEPIKKKSAWDRFRARRNDANAG